MKKKILIFGASSEIGICLSKKLFKQDFLVVLASSSQKNLSNLKKKFKSQNFKFEKINFLNDENKILKFISKYNKFDHIYLIPSFTVKNQLLSSNENIDKLLKINFSFYVKFLNSLNKKRKLSNCHIHFISSVSAIRSRGKNTIYSSCKVAMEFYLKGLYHKNINNNFKLSIIRLGFIDNFRQKTNKIKIVPPIKPRLIADFLLNNLEIQKITYFPFYWLFISIFLKMIPKQIYNKMQFLNN